MATQLYILILKICQKLNNNKMDKKYPYYTNMKPQDFFVPVVFEGVDVTKNGIFITRFIWCLN